MAPAPQPALPLRPTTVVGSHALPSWLWLAREAMAAGRFGTTDVTETLEDATRTAIADQVEAGVDIVSDGEMRRVNFILGFFERFRGIEKTDAPRKMGAPHWDSSDPFLVKERITAPEGLGTIADFELARRATTLPMKATCPGPLTLAIPLWRGEVYKTKEALLEDLVPIVNAELKGLVAAGADFIQIDEPIFAMRHGEGKPLVDLFNRTVEGVDAKIALHICFGNLNNKTFAAPRTYAHLYPHVLDAHAQQLVFEYGNREMGELALWKEFPSEMELGFGCIDVKAFRSEEPEDVAVRIRKALEYVAPEKLYINPDCGFWDTPRWVCKKKLAAMVEGTRIVRRELQGSD